MATTFPTAATPELPIILSRFGCQTLTNRHAFGGRDLDFPRYCLSAKLAEQAVHLVDLRRAQGMLHRTLDSVAKQFYIVGEGNGQTTSS